MILPSNSTAKGQKASALSQTTLDDSRSLSLFKSLPKMLNLNGKCLLKHSPN